MPSVLITGCDRGLGTDVARQYAADGWRVHATCLDPAAAPGLDGLPENVTVHKLDVTEPEDFARVAAALGGAPLDILFSNAALGIRALRGHDPALGTVDFQVMERMYRTNALGPLRLVETFIDNVARSDRRMIAVVSSRMGSIAFNRVGGAYGYRASKAALNAIARSLSVDLLPRKVAVVALHPGNAKTYPPDGTVEVADSVAGMRAVLARCGIEDTGSFYMYNDTPLPW